jgi:CDP-6-deoxy-D-xylo-4-hexulose-3-dehydrase
MSKKRELKRLTKWSNIFKEHDDFVRTAIPFPDSEIIWMHYPIIINEGSPFSRKDFQTFFELRGIQTRPPFSGNILNQPMMKDQKFIANDSYNNANDPYEEWNLIGNSSRLI